MPGVEVDFGAGPRQIASSTRVLNLGGGDSSLAPAEGPVDWSQLDKLPACITVEWSGAERGIVDALATHPNIRFLYWNEASGDIDLTTTRLGTVRLDGARLRHTFASLLVAKNVSPKVIQARMGHASITETMDTYGHLYPESEEVTRSAIDDALGASEIGSVGKLMTREQSA
ncbi:tyrosine-type recombinase/integrase [Nonomuraea sp. NPDC049784]|uniref:tyrosine-type recombinase/integrase n=1 Tax=Nonomuraea sp. NPDC049784 TaxID=3154361 RepID=UPI0033D59A65